MSALLPTDESLAALFASLKVRKIKRMDLVDATRISYARLSAIEHKRGQPASDYERQRIAQAIPQLLKN